tara:strand:- start:1025 stop:1546 length:522 start_codon:yes stop_codon:yes gene_type:complete
MAITLGASGITFNDGSVQEGADRVLGCSVQRSSNRASIGQGDRVVMDHVFTRKATDSDIRAKYHGAGTGHYCYPYYRVYAELVAPNGTAYRSYVGGHYQRNSENVNSSGGYEVMMICDHTWAASEIQSVTGSWRVRYGWAGSNCKIWNVESYNSNDDNRAYQQGQQSIIREYR